MNNDYSQQIEVFCFPESRAETESFFSAYWLSQSDYSEDWEPTQKLVFDPRAKYLPDQVFQEGYYIIPTPGGSPFNSEDDFRALQECMRHVGDRQFAVIQNMEAAVKVYYGGDDYRVHPPLRFHFPIDVSWNELCSGRGISFELFNSSYKDFFVFGNGAHWGRYVSPESPSKNYQVPIEITLTGFEREHADIFKSAYEEFVDNRIWAELPTSYAGRRI